MNTPNPERARKQTLEGLIIKNSLFGEGHRLITIIEKNKAKVDIMAFGAGREKSTRRSALIVGHVVECEVKRKNPDSPFSLKEVKVLQQFSGITGAYNKVSWFYLLAEILDVCLETGSSLPDYQSLLDTLVGLDNSDSPSIVSLLYIFRFLREEGVFPHYSEDLRQVLGEFTHRDVQLGAGSLHFLTDSARTTEPHFWDNKRLSSAVIRELLDIILITLKFHYQKELNSLDLIQI